ncbi:uncharacterized protein LOC106013271 [Aplysia californica]|uniref:Uncharacterized protein LOC106013271 n=1 Tax=Aplysia californica TaxID=6500 RepID=A0ABM1AAG1_APLCA|nr:uncharacterized protein LOC106013271 [Aplysia californica]
MPRQCLPDSAIHTSSGFIGDNETAVETYAYSLPGSPTVYTAIVDRKACMAVQMTFNSGAAVPDSGDLGSLQVSDVTMGIKDPSIFTPPKSCDGLEEEVIRVFVF